MAAPNSVYRKFLKYLLPVLLWAGLIFLVSSIPGSDIPPLFAYQDVVFHIFEYVVFGLLIIRALKSYYPILNITRCIYLTFLVCLIYAIGDEFHQSFIPYREATIVDVCFDSLGSAIGIWFWFSKVYNRFLATIKKVRIE